MISKRIDPEGKLALCSKRARPRVAVSQPIFWASHTLKDVLAGCGRQYSYIFVDTYIE